MEQLIINLVADGGYSGVALLMALENVIPLLPSEVILALGGMAVARGNMQFWPMLMAATIGATVGNYVWFLLGDRLGYRRMRPVIDRWGRWLTLEWEDVENAARFLRRQGQWIVFFLRFSPFLRTMISLPAGMAHMSHWRFLAFTFAGSLIWNAAIIEGSRLLGIYLGEGSGWMTMMLVLLLAATLLAYVWRVLTWKPRAECEDQSRSLGWAER